MGEKYFECDGERYESFEAAERVAQKLDPSPPIFEVIPVERPWRLIAVTVFLTLILLVYAFEVGELTRRWLTRERALIGAGASGVTGAIVYGLSLAEGTLSRRRVTSSERE